MKTRIALSLLSLASCAAFAKTAFAETALAAAPAAIAPAAQANLYFTADSAISFAALTLATTVMMAANVGWRRREARVQLALDPETWRDEVFQKLEADLQNYSRRLRRAA